MRGYFAVGAEGISKGFNLGNLVRTSHAFGASFFFTVGSALNYGEIKSTDTSHADIHMPFYSYPTMKDFTLPKDCALVGVELPSPFARRLCPRPRRWQFIARNGSALRSYRQNPHQILRQCWYCRSNGDL